jgi:hypothetical protein
MSASTIRFAAAAFGAALLIGGPIAHAQQPVPKPAEEHPLTKDIPDDKLNAAAAALADVIELQHDYKQRIAAAPDGDRERITTEGNNALEKAVTDKGLSVDEFSDILQVAQNDPDLREKLVQRASTIKKQ